MNRLNRFVAVAGIAWGFAAAHAANVFDDTLYTPAVPAWRSLGDLAWKIPSGATLSNGWLVVEQKPGADGTCPRTTWAAMPLDLASCSGRGVELRMTVSGDRLGKPDPAYFGFKFMLQVTCADGATLYPAAGAPGTSFGPTELTLRTDFVGRTITKATLFLGLQAIPGRVAFDLGTLKMRVTPYPYPETNADLKAVYTPAFRERFRGRFRGVMSPARRMTEDDFKTLRAWGANLLRYQMACNDAAVLRRFPIRETEAEKIAFFKAWIAGSLDHLEKDLIPWARQYGFRITVDLHSAPGGQADGGILFTSDACARCFVDTWREIAARFKGQTDVIYGYDLVNEPNQRGLAKYDYWTLQKLAANAIRRVDPETPIVIESNGHDAPATFAFLRPLALDNVIYQVHMYLPFAFTHQGVGTMPKGPVYPDPAKGWNRDHLEKQLQPVWDFAARHGARIYVGEFSAINWAEGAGTWMRDAIDVFERHEADWTFHAFREWPAWSVEHVKGFQPSSDNPRKRALLDGFGARASEAKIAPAP